MSYWSQLLRDTSSSLPSSGPQDVLKPGVDGVLSENLKDACLSALRLDRNVVHRSSMDWDWDTCFQTFLSHLALLIVVN